MDAGFWSDVFNEEMARPLFVYPGALGGFVQNEFARDSLVVFMGSSKRGKSWWLLDASYRCLRNKHHVAYFEAGDLSRRQIGFRMGQRALRRPRASGEYDIPVKYSSKDDSPEKEKRWLDGITEGECLAEWGRLQRGRDLFRLSCHSNRSLSVLAVESRLRDWAFDGWTPDVVVIDYADIMAPYPGVKEGRDAINENWMHLRRITQDYHCLVVTATQADAGSYSQRLLGRKNFNNDRRVHDHVTAMLALNVTDEDKGQGVARVNFLDRREGEFTESRQVWVAGCLAIGCPVMKSTV
jgi:replicative DNA helicase